jgi:hypothetical protein
MISLAGSHEKTEKKYDFIVLVLRFLLLLFYVTMTLLLSSDVNMNISLIAFSEQTMHREAALKEFVEFFILILNFSFLIVCMDFYLLSRNVIIIILPA